MTGKKPITLSWWNTEYDYELDKWFEDDVAAVDNKLIIQKVNRYNEGTYTCKAVNAEGKDEAVFKLKIICKSSFLFHKIGNCSCYSVHFDEINKYIQGQL